MTNREMLLKYAAVQGWLRVRPEKTGKLYGPGFLTNPQRNWQKVLDSFNRKVAFRLRSVGQCLFCLAPLPPGSTGDHLIPLSEGGPDDSTNYSPLCRSCNASKNRRDFMLWWQSKGRVLPEIDLDILADVLCAYARLSYAMLSEKGELDRPAPGYLETAFQQLQDIMPPGHWQVILSLTP